MKSLIIYYSRDGNTKKVAEKLAEKINADIEEITEQKSRGGPIGWLKSGAESARGIIPEIDAVKSDVSSYDLVVVGSPVWANTISSPLRAFLVKHGADIKDIASFLTMGGEPNETPLTEINDRSGLTPRASVVLRTSAIKNGSYLSELDVFAGKLV